ncbi:MULTISPECIES: TetR/AcrR family transcriptional regulator [Kocuria]|uniref:TetR/AcrR family transcriptional regulator n=1 Tax=Kocuria oceani TaxID=988827 RepID=A0ABV9TDV9_9MICC|nr:MULTISPECIES: TetR/AcrR family transcriptional regulator [Kocuria]KLU08304.1 TetR family transcriptional regulator [Kocuria sp. SM24M-10]
MPRVSQQYKDERRREIVAAASRCFLEHGFGGASMHRIIAATGLSAGALYNHFPSKHELVVASARAALDRVLTADEDPAPAGDEGTARAAAGEGSGRSAGATGGDPAGWVAELLERLAADPAATRLLLITWGEAVSEPALAAVAGEHLARVREQVEERYGRWAAEELGLGPDRSREWVAMFAQAILSVLQGYVVQSCLLPGFDHDAYLDYARTLAAQ